ncbi:MAG: serine/threonine-protein kinase [Myxococcota bacterium]
MGGFPEPGELFEGKYRIRDLLGSGGFARVYRAEQTDLGREVALKILSPQVSSLASNDSVDSQLESVAIRFEREAQVVSRLRSPFTITVYDYGRTGSGLLYMVLEYVDGLELDEVDVPLEPRRVARVLEQVLKSLQEAHAHDLLHRDLKPANIMLYEHLGEKDQVKLLDFGIAKMVGEAQKEKREEQDLTAADSLIGTPRYMSPEQIRGENVGPASDIYSLGLVIYELLVGEKAITSSDSIEILGKHLSAESFELPADINIHPDVRAIVNQMLVKDMSQRYATTEEVLADVQALEKVRGDLSGEFADLPPVPDEDESWANDIVFEGYEGEEAEESDERRSFVWLAVAALVVLIGGGIAFFAMQGDKPETQEKQAAVAEKVEPAPKPEKEPEPEPEPQPIASKDGKLTRVETSPSGAMVYVGERLVGQAPAEFGADDFDFPVEVRVELENATVTQALEEPGGTMMLEMEGALADARAAEQREEAERLAEERERRREARERREKERRDRSNAAATKDKSDDKPEKEPEPESDDDSGGSGYIPLE